MAKQTFLQMVNTLSQLCIGKDAQTTGIRPTKTQLQYVVNNAHKEVCRTHSDWTFMNKVGVIKGYENGDTVSDVSIAVDSTSIAEVGEDPSQTDYLASEITIGQHTEVSSLGIHIGSAYVAGVGVHESTVRLLLCNFDSAGNPDVDNPILYTESATLLQTTGTSTITITYADSTTESLSIANVFELDVETPYAVYAGRYAVVLEVIASSTSGDGIKSAGRSSTVKGKYKLGSASWASDLSMLYTVYVNGVEAVLLSDFPVSTAWEVIWNLKDKDGRIYSRADNQQDGHNPLSNKFYISGYNSDGTFNVRVHTDYAQTLNWVAYGKANCLDMNLDADLHLLPITYDDLIVDYALLSCIGLNWLINMPIKSEEITARITNRMKALRRDYRPNDLRLGVDVTFQTFTPDYTTVALGTSSHTKTHKPLNR